MEPKMEYVFYPLYDIVEVGYKKQAKFFIDIAGKDQSETNMPQPGMLPYPMNFRMLGISTSLLAPPVEKLNSISHIYDSNINFFISAKRYLDMPFSVINHPQITFETLKEIYKTLHDQLSGKITLNGQIEPLVVDEALELIHYTYPVSASIEKDRAMIHIQSCQDFRADLHIKETFYPKVKVMIILHGILGRPTL